MEEEVKKIQYTRYLPPVVGVKLAWAMKKLRLMKSQKKS